MSAGKFSSKMLINFRKDDFCRKACLTKRHLFQHLCVFFRGVSGGIVVLLSLLKSFVASTRLIWPEIGAIDDPDHIRQVFEQ